MRKSLAVLAAVGVFGAFTASAATLGGLNSASLGADQTVVASCDTDGVSLSYGNDYNSATNKYDTTTVTLSGVASNCDGSAFELTLSDGKGALTETRGTVTTANGVQVVALDAAVPASSITAASLVISG